jgi:hypothetical protein
MLGFPHEISSISEAYARIILTWHKDIGLHRIPTKMVGSSGEARLDQQEKYRVTVAHFSKADLRQRRVQTELAQTQISGIFEWFYGEEIPMELFHNYHDILPANPPHRLNEAARYILALRETAPVEDILETQKSERNNVRFQRRDELLGQAHTYYAVYINEEQLGIGGASFLLSCSLERSRDGFNDSGAVTLLTPESLGFKVDTSGADHFLNQVREGNIRIAKVEGN